MESAIYKQQVSEAASEIASTKQALGFVAMQANNTDNPEDKNRLGNQIEQLKGNLEGAASRHGSTLADLRGAEAFERREKLAEETTKQKEEQASIEKQAEAAKTTEKEVDNKDKKPTIAKKESGATIGGELFDRTGPIPEDPVLKQAALLKQIQEFAKTSSAEAKEPHADEVKDKPAVVANVAATPVIASTAATGVAQDTPTATSKIQGAAGSSGAST